MMQEEKKVTEETIEQELSLNDDRRVKVLSPGALVAKRFFRNRLAVVGLTMLVVMFVFSFIGGLISPYGQDEQFYTYTHMDKEYVGVVKNNDLRYTINDGQEFSSILQAQLMLAIGKNAESFEYKDVTYEVEKEGEDLYLISSNGTVLAIAAKDIVNAADGTEASALTFAVKHEALKAYAKKLLLLRTVRIIPLTQMEIFYPAAMRLVMSAVSLYRQRKTALSSAVTLKKNWQMPSTATPKNLYTPIQTVRNTLTPSPTNRIPRPGLYCSRRKPMCMTVMQVPPKHTGSAPIQTVWIC